MLLNDGQGHFVTAANPFSLVSRASVDVELGDVDNNGKLDIVIANANPMRANVVAGPPGGPWTAGSGANKRRNELWLNYSTPGSLAFLLVVLPDPPGLPSPTAAMPYNDPGFWNDTRSVALGDIDNDLDVDILFANNGWAQGEPDQLSNTLIYGTLSQYFSEHHGQAPQLLLNMGGIQAGLVPDATGFMQLAEFLDVGYYALPYGRTAHMTVLNPDGTTSTNPNGGVRVGSDFELTRQFTAGGPSDVGRPSDLTIAYSGGSTGGLPQDPVPDGFPDLLVVRGVNALSTVLINSANWSMVQNPVTMQWYTRGRFFRGDIQLNADWNSVGNEFKNLWEVQPWDEDGNGANDRGPYTGKYTRFEFWEAHEMYASDGDWVDLDKDGLLDVVMSSSEPTHGQINGVFFYRGMGLGFRWKGPSDEGAVMPYVNTVLSYGVDTGDVDADGDVDIVVAGVPSALALRNEGGAQGGTEGFFEEHTFQDKGGWLPMTGHAPLYAPLLTETVALFDAESNDGPLEMMFTGYPAYDSLGQAYHFSNEAEHWHFYDTGYHNPVTDPAPTPSSPVLPHCTFYAGQDASGVYQDRSLSSDPATGLPWLDRNGRIRENISDEVRQADLDNDGDQDLVVAYRNFAKDVHPHVTSWPSRLDPATHQVVLSLWMNDSSGHLRDEAHARLGPSWQADGAGADNYFWDATAGDRYEGLAFADVDSDGDLDALATGTTSGTTNPKRNRLFVNMGGDQKSAGGGSHRTGEFRVAGLANGPLAGWSGKFGSNYPNSGPVCVDPSRGAAR